MYLVGNIVSLSALPLQDFLRQQEEYRRQQQQQQQQQQHPDHSVQDTVRNIIANTDFRDFEVSRPRSPGALSAGAALTSGGRRVIQVRSINNFDRGIITPIIYLCRGLLGTLGSLTVSRANFVVTFMGTLCQCAI